MESENRRHRQEHPRKNANLLSIATFGWLIPIFIAGVKREFEEDDIYEPLKDHESNRLGDLLEAAWRKEEKRSNPSLWRAFGRVFGLRLIFLGLILFFTEVVVKIAQPLALSRLLAYYTSSNSELTDTDAYIYASLIVGSSFLNVVVSHHYILGNQHIGMQIRIASCSLIYRKALKLSQGSLEDTTIGQMVNLLSNDVGRFDTAMNHFHSLWVSPIETAIIVILIYFHLGFTGAIGSIFLILFIPIQIYLGKKSSIYRLATALRTDERVRLMNEIISGIQVIKMYNWEKPFVKLVSFVRMNELKQILLSSYISGFMISLKGFAATVSIYLCIVAYLLSSENLTAQYVFVLTSYYNILKTILISQFPSGISEFAEAYVSVKRVRTFLLYDEKESQNDITAHQQKYIYDLEKIKDEKQALSGKIHNGNFYDEIEPATIRITEVSAKWSNNETKSTLSKISLEITEKRLVALVGQVGSGKTSLLHVILRELPLSEGILEVKGKVSFASQEPWLFAGSIRQNIIFGNIFDPERYENVVKACALEKDLVLFPFGDRTIVGERGATLSGGQRARINLARAVYQEADIYLLDDPLSAVDTNVGKHLFEECITKFLKEKIIVLVTHQLQYLHNADRIILLEDGTIVQNGKFNEIKDNKFYFLKDLSDNNESKFVDDHNKEEQIIQKIESGFTEKSGPKLNSEVKASGNVSPKVYWSYFNSGGSLFALSFMCFLFILCQIFASGGDFFVSYWTNIEQDLEDENGSGTVNVIRNNGIFIYTIIILLNVIVTIARLFLYYNFCMSISQNIHNEMFSHIIYASIRFFNITPSGRILNRFSKDMGNMDEILPGVLIDSLQIGLSVLGICVVVSIVNYWMIITSCLVFLLFYGLRILFLATSRSIKRLEGVTRSPIFTHLHASLQGLTTIRAFKAEDMLKKEFDNHQNYHSATNYMFIACSRAFGYWLDLICVIYIAAVTYSFLLMSTDQYAGTVGLAITQALALTGMLQWGMRQWSELENQMTSVERVLEYTEVETERERTELIPKLTWPENGNIKFKSVYLKYSDDDPYVLKDLNFAIKSQEKIGIVGRTGAGKSSIITALFQLFEIEGEILIDNLDITKIPLDTLRNKISIIPQEPVLFSGTLRKNLDPFEEYSDETLWNALEQVQLKQVVAELNLGLKTKMSEGGSNFSVGQRQLVCLARAIIRNNKILIMDEATANIDHQTDQLIQETIRRQFVDCTVLTIAHRLHTVMDSDKILVLDSGRIMEFDSPYNLLQNSGGWLYSLVQDMGSSMMENLYKIANRANENNKQ